MLVFGIGVRADGQRQLVSPLETFLQGIANGLWATVDQLATINQIGPGRVIMMSICSGGSSTTVELSACRQADVDLRLLYKTGRHHEKNQQQQYDVN